MVICTRNFLLKYLGTYCNVIRTYIVGDEASRVHKKGFYVCITRTVRYFLLFVVLKICGVRKMVLYVNYVCTVQSFVHFWVKKRFIVYNRFVKRYMVFTVWYCCVIWVLARWSYVKWFVKIWKKSFFQILKNFIYVIGFYNFFLKLRGESSGSCKKNCFKEGVKDWFH